MDGRRERGWSSVALRRRRLCSGSGSVAVDGFCLLRLVSGGEGGLSCSGRTTADARVLVSVC